MRKFAFVFYGTVAALAVCMAFSLGRSSADTVQLINNRAEHAGKAAELNALRIETGVIAARVENLESRRPVEPVRLETTRVVAAPTPVGPSQAPIKPLAHPGDHIASSDVYVSKLVTVNPRHGASRINWNDVDSVIYHTDVWVYSGPRLRDSSYKAEPRQIKLDDLDARVADSLKENVSFPGEKVRIFLGSVGRYMDEVRDFEIVSVTYKPKPRGY